ncbi:MAG: thymidylate kinase [Terriglobales bacterium]
MSFSGIDGAGKTTQIDAVLAWLRDAGLRVRSLRFWNDIAVLGQLRETMSHTVFKSEKGVGSPDKPVQRRDKNVRAWYMTAARLFLYFLDTVRLAFVVATTSGRDVDVVVFDRYLYDELANLNLGNPVVRAYTGLLLKLVPHPDIAFLLDTDPVQAQARKPEYPLDFLHSTRASYLALVKLADGMTVIAPLAVEDVTRAVLREVDTALDRSAPKASPTSSRLSTTDLTAGLTSKSG